MKFECAFLYVAPGCDPAKDVARIEGDSINMNVVGMANYAQAEEIAKEMAAKGCSAIELCAGFGNACRYGAHSCFGYQFHGNSCIFVGIFQIIDQFSQILNGINIMMWRRGDQTYSWCRMFLPPRGRPFCRAGYRPRRVLLPAPF